MIRHFLAVASSIAFAWPIPAQAPPAVVASRDPIVPQTFGAKCRGEPADATGDLAAIQAAINAAHAADRPLHFPGLGKACFISGALKLSGRMVIQGDGPNAVTIVQLANAPVFDWEINGSAENSEISGLRLRGQFVPNTDYSQSRGILIHGDSHYFTHNTFSDLTIQGMWAGIEVNKTPYKSGYGLEQPVSYNIFDRVIIYGGARPLHYGYYFPSGSGTGNRFTNNDIALTGDVTGAMFRFEGAGAVVGDIKILGGEFGSLDKGARMFSVGAGTVYRSNILISGTQAELTSVWDLDDAGVAYQLLRYEDNNSGGALRLGDRMANKVSASVIHDFGTDDRRAGNLKSATGHNMHVPLFSIDLRAAPYTGTRCTVTASGGVNSVGGGAVTATWLIGRSGAALSIVPIVKPTATLADPRFMTLTAVAEGGTAVTIALDAAGAGSGGLQADTQIACSSGTYRLSRL